MKTKEELEDYYKKLNRLIPRAETINNELSRRIKDYNNAVSVELNEELLKSTKINNKVIWILTGLNIIIAILSIYFNFFK